MLDWKHKGALAMPTATVLRESGPATGPRKAGGRVDRAKLSGHCPLRDAPALDAYLQALRAGSSLSLRTQAFLAAQQRPAVGLWIRDCTKQGRLLFSPWSMEILFLVGVFGSLRFGELEGFLGTSSRTISVKLQKLCRAGFLERRVVPGPPLRTSYALTVLGKGTAAAASPLMAHLNLAAVGAIAR